MAMTSPLSDLSPDARNHVFGFLSLEDCLRYSRVSKSSLIEAIPHLEQRRWDQFCERKAYRLLPNPCQLVSLKDLPANNIPSNITGPDVLLQSMDNENDNNNDATIKWHILPSARERIQGLYRALPSSHPSNDLLKELVQDLAQKQSPVDADHNKHQVEFPRCLPSLRSVTKAHRLHETILANSTVQCEPVATDRAWMVTNVEADPRLSLTVTLDQYWGDVLVACVLMGNSIGGLVEGCTTLEQWLQQFHNNVSSSAEEALNGGTSRAPVTGYKQWVFLHSTFLRTMPMTVEHLERLKLTPICGMKGSTSLGDSVELHYVQPPFCFVAEECDFGQPKSRNHQLRVIQEIVTAPTQWCHQTTLNDFGPLGPSFRGRDRIRSVSFSNVFLGNYLHNECNAMIRMCEPPMIHHVPCNSNLYRWLTLRLDLPVGVFPDADEMGMLDGGRMLPSWIMELSDECYKNRPMTVQTPIVSLALA